MAESNLKHIATEQHGTKHGTPAPNADSHDGKTHHPKDTRDDDKHGHPKAKKDATERTPKMKISALISTALALSTVIALGQTPKNVNASELIVKDKIERATIKNYSPLYNKAARDEAKNYGPKQYLKNPKAPKLKNEPVSYKNPKTPGFESDTVPY
jgi:hypothetical protein